MWVVEGVVEKKEREKTVQNLWKKTFNSPDSRHKNDVSLWGRKGFGGNGGKETFATEVRIIFSYEKIMK